MIHIPHYINNEEVLRLELLDAIHPILVNVKADHWHFIYKIYHINTLYDYGLFSNNYLICKKRRVLIIEEYNNSVLNKNQIKTDEDVIKNLRIFDLINNKTGKFSKLSSGSFLLYKIDGDTLYYSKRYPDKTSEFEVNLTEIELAKIGVLRVV